MNWPRSRWWIPVVVLILLGGAYLLWPAVYAGLPPRLSGEGGRLADVLAIEPSWTIAEIGAGSGGLTVDLASRLGPDGRMYSTELDPDRLAQIRRAVEAAGLTNVEVVEAGERDTNLPAACCQAIFMRNVYHHVTDPASFNRSLRRSLVDGGRIAIIDFEPGAFWHLLDRPAGTSGNRRGHGVVRENLAREMSAAGFTRVRTIETWGGHQFLMLFGTTD